MRKSKLIFRPSSPLIVDRWLEVAFIVMWAIYGTWGFGALINGIPTVYDATLPWYQMVWAGCIGILAYVAGLSALGVFFNVPPSLVTKKRIERAAVVVLSAFVAIYPILLFVAAFEGQTNKVATAILSLSYLVFPVYRIYQITQKLKLYSNAPD